MVLDTLTFEDLNRTYTDTTLNLERRAAALLLMGDLNENREAVLEALLKATRERDETFRSHAAASLAKCPERKAHPALVALLKDPTPEVRYQAIHALGEREDSRALMPLAEYFGQAANAEDYIGQQNVLTALETLKDPRAAPWLESIAKTLEPLLTDFLRNAAKSCNENTHFLYTYVGEDARCERAKTSSQGKLVTNLDQVRAVVEADDETQYLLGGGRPFSYIVNKEEGLVLGPLRSEHVDLAKGEPVLGAGEIGLSFKEPLRAVYLNNRSTGYQPGLASYACAARALQRAGLKAPGQFTEAYSFFDGIMSKL